MTVTMALDLILALLARSAEISALYQKARAEGREDLTPEESAQIKAAYASALTRLDDSIARAEAEGR